MNKDENKIDLETLVNTFKSQIGSKGKGELVREKLNDLEQVWTGKLNDERNQEKVLINLWNRLIKVSLELENIDLALLVIARLKLTRIARVIQSILMVRANEVAVSVGLAYVAREFGLEYQPKNQFDEPKSIFSIDILLELLINQGKWSEAKSLVDGSYKGTKASLMKRRLSFRHAQHLESDESYCDALAKYEEAKVEANHAFRILSKLHLGRVIRELKDYWMTEERKLTILPVHYFETFNWQEDVRNNLEEFCLSGELGPINTVRLISTLSRSDSKRFDMIEDKIIESQANDEVHLAISPLQLRDQNHIDRKSFLKLINAKIESSLQIQLAQIACLNLKRNMNSQRVSCYLLGLNQFESYIRLNETDRLAKMELLARESVDPYTFVSNLPDVLRTRQNAKRVPNSNLSLLLLKLGLVDEALEYVQNSNEIRQNLLSECVGWFGQIVDTKVGQDWSWMDPEICETTLLKFSKASNDNLVFDQELQEEQTQATNVIKYVIFALIVFIDKLKKDEDNVQKMENDPESEFILQEKEQQTSNEWLRKLEIMFYYLAKFLKDFTFSVCNEESGQQLVKATSLLMKLSRSKMDSIKDSEIIRDSFRQLVDCIASRCLMEAQYKQAASLFSQMGNHMEACKCLMREGDIGVVIDFALITNDIAVNRITLNYLRHLNAKPEVIRDFIARTKGSSSLQRVA